MWSNQQNKGTRVPLFYDLTTHFLDSCAEIHQIFELSFWKI